MTGVSPDAEEFRGSFDRLPSTDRLVAVLFRDAWGLALFLGALCYIALVTRVGIFINDSYTTANAFVALLDGHLAVEEAVFGPSLDTPGMEIVDGKHYGRNYGQLVLSLPAYWLLRGVGVIAELRIALVGTWSLTLLGLSLVVGRLLDRRRVFALGGSGIALVLFLANVAVATPIPDRIVPVLAMQLTSMVAGGFVAVLTYRLGAWFWNPRTGLLTGVLTILATPIGFWAPIPKRHVFTTVFVLLALLAFAKSRNPDAPWRDIVHGGAYAANGLLAWIHAPEALVLFTTLVVGDIVTSPRERIYAVPTVGAIFAVSLVPFLVTNFLISGNPFVPPRLLRAFDIAGQQAPTGGAETGSGGTSTGSGSFGLVERLPIVLQWVIAAVVTFFSLLLGGIEAVLTHPEHLFQTFIRSGYVVQGVPVSDEAINLSVLESAPVLGVLIAAPALALSRRPSVPSLLERRRQPTVATGLAIALFALLFTLLYVERLPLHAQITVRYLLPLYPIGVLAVVWLPPIRHAWRSASLTFAWAASAGVFLGGQLLVVILAQSNLALGEAFQLHALLGLALAGVLAIATLLSIISGPRFDRFLSASLGLATASTVVFTLLVVTAYADGLGKYPVDGSQLLPILRVLADLLGVV